MTRERVELLVRLGLSPAEARVYVALLEEGPAPAAAVAARAEVPRNRVYEVLAALAGRRLVEIRLEEVRTFAARPVGPFLDERRRTMDEERRALEQRRRAVRHLFTDPPEGAAGQDGGGFRAVRRRRDATDAVVRVLGEAQSRALVVSTVPTLRRLLNHAVGTDVLRGLADRGVAARIVVGPGGDAGEIARAVGVPVRVAARAPAIHRFAADGRVAVLLQVGHDDDRVYVGDDAALVVESPHLAQEAAHVGALTWAGARPVAEG